MSSSRKTSRRCRASPGRGYRSSSGCCTRAARRCATSAICRARCSRTPASSCTNPIITASRYRDESLPRRPPQRRPRLGRLHRLVLQEQRAPAGFFLKGRAPRTSTYLLSVKADAPSGAVAIPADLTVLTPRVRTGLDNDRIAALYPDRRLDYFAAARWSGPLDEVVQDLP